MAVNSTSLFSPDTSFSLGSEDSEDSAGSLRDFIVPDHLPIDAHVHSPATSSVRSLRSRDVVVKKSKKRKVDEAKLDDKKEIKKAEKTPNPPLKIIGRDTEVGRIVRMLCQSTPQRPLLLGRHGIGKCAIVDKTAQYLDSPECPKSLSGRKIVRINCKELVGEALSKSKDEVTILQKKILESQEDHENAIFFFRDIDDLMNDESSIGKLFQGFLQREDIAVIGSVSDEVTSSNTQEAIKFYSRYNFQPIVVEEQSREETEAIVVEYMASSKNPLKVKIEDEVVTLAVKLVDEHLKLQPFPLKAIQFVSEAIAVVSKNKKSNPFVSGGSFKIESGDVLALISEKTKIPVDQLVSTDLEKLNGLFKSIREQLVGQDTAINTMFECIKTAMSGFRNKKKPCGVYLFVGPTGVGKTELAKVVASVLHWNFIRVDMSEYKEAHNVSRLIGSPPGYVGYESGGGLTNDLRKNPQSVVLFDEMEKAHPDVVNVLLQVFDDGRLTDGQGITTDCTKAMFIMTSNLGAKTLFAQKSVMSDEELVDRIIPLVIAQWSPEFEGRIKVVPFHNLHETDHPIVLEVHLKKLALEVLEGHSMKLTWKPAVIPYLIEKHEKALRSGIRGLCGQVSKDIYNILADAKLARKIDSNQDVVLVVEDQKLIAKKG